MPLYEYQCEKCGHRFEKIESVSAIATKKCPKCGARAVRLLSAPSFQFKGSGWYATDYGGKSVDSASAEKSEEKAATKSEDKTDKKPPTSKDTAKKTKND